METYELQERLEAVMPWVGLYITAASAICTVAMAADVVNGFRLKKWWFPCKYFSLNATSLTLLAVAMKLPMDVNTIMTDTADVLVKSSSLIFMIIALPNFMSSLGSMNDKNILPNVAALGILVITIAGDMCAQIIAMRMVSANGILFYWLPVISLLLMLVSLVSLALTVPSTKRSVELKYQEKHKATLGEDTSEDQKGEMMKYWVMAETCSPQFVLARAILCAASAVVCMCSAVMLATYNVLTWTSTIRFRGGTSPYGNYTTRILYIQSVGAVVGTIPPMSRWLISVSLKCSGFKWQNLRQGFKIEAYWIQTLVDMRESFAILHIRQTKFTRYLHNLKWLTLTFLIKVQILIVLFNKLLFLLSALLMLPFFLCFTHITKPIGSDEDDLKQYVLLLEGEVDLPTRVLKNICREADNIVKEGKKKQPHSLIDLLGVDEVVGFNGVGQFDSNEIRSLHSHDPPNCWTLPVVTLISIAVALPKGATAMHKVGLLLRSVGEGLLLAKAVDETLVGNAELVNIQNAADICWVRVLLYKKWLDIDLRRVSLTSENSNAALQELSDKAENTVVEFKKEVKDSVMENPLNWPAKVIVANSMYRISQTILMSFEEETRDTDDEALFERLCVMVADILAACLTNLPRAITIMCHRNAIEKRGNSVRRAFLLLGKTEQLVELVQQRQQPNLDRDEAADIEAWRHALFLQHQENPATSSLSSSSYEMVATSVSCDD